MNKDTSVNYKRLTLRFYPDIKMREMLWNILSSSMHASNKYIEYTNYLHNQGKKRISDAKFHKMYVEYKNMDIDTINMMDDSWYKDFALSIKERSCKKDAKAVQEALHRVSLSYLYVYEYNKKLKKGDKKAHVHFRTYRRYKRASFYFHNRNPKDVMLIDDNHLKLPILGVVKILHIGKYKNIISNIKSGNVIIDHGRWYVALAYSDIELYHIDSNNYGIGIDYGVRKLLTISKVNEKQTKASYIGYVNNYTKNKEYLKMIKRYKSLQRAIEHKAYVNYIKLINDYLDNHNGEMPSINDDNKLKSLSYRTNKIDLLYSKLYMQSTHIVNYRKDKLYKITNKLIYDIKPSFIKIEDLNVSEMVSNDADNNSITAHKLHKNIMEITPSMFKLHLINKGYDYNIPILLVDQYYPSTQTCSCCGYILQGNERLTKKDKKFICPKCGYKEDRDINASKNIALTQNYTIAKKR